MIVGPLIGIAESGFLPGLAFFMTLWFPKACRARAIAGYIIAISVASVKSLGDLSDLQVGFLSALPPLLGVVGTIIVSRSSDKTGDRKFHLAGLYVVAAAGLLASAYAGSPVMAYVLLCVAGLCLNSGNSLFWSLASSISTGAAAAVAVAAVNTIAQFGGLVGPYVIGLAKAQTGNFTAALVVVSAFVLVAAVVAVVLPVNARQAAERPRSI